MEREIARLTKRLYSVEASKSCRSLAEPTGDPPGYFQPFSTSGLKKLAARKHKVTQAQFVTKVPELAGDVARFDVVLDAEPFSPAAVAMLDRLDQYFTRLAADPDSAWHGAQFVFVGTTSGIRDLAAVTSSDQGLIQRLVVLAVLAVLLVLLRRPLDLPVPDRLGAVQLLRDDRRHAAGFSRGCTATRSRGSTGRCRSSCS